MDWISGLAVVLRAVVDVRMTVCLEKGGCLAQAQVGKARVGLVSAG